MCDGDKRAYKRQVAAIDHHQKDDTAMTVTLFVIGIIATILCLVGCARTTTSMSRKEEDALYEELHRSTEEFNNGPIYRELTEQNIDTTTDEKLLQVVADNLLEKLGDDYENEYATVMSWNRSRRAILLIWLLEGEVNNGGHYQFYQNSSGIYYAHVPDALELVGAFKYADVTRRANIQHEKDLKAAKELGIAHEDLIKPDDDNDPIVKADDEFFALEKIENLHQLQVDYIRRNKQDFIDK